MPTDRSNKPVARNIAIYLSGFFLLGCGLDPLYEPIPDNPDQYGIDIKDTAYSINLRQTQIMYPSELNQLMLRADVSHLILEFQSRESVHFAPSATSGPGGQQDVCASTTRLALALWNGPQISDRRRTFFYPLQYRCSVRSHTDEATIAENGDWSPMTIQALVDTRDDRCAPTRRRHLRFYWRMPSLRRWAATLHRCRHERDSYPG